MIVEKRHKTSKISLLDQGIRFISEYVKILPENPGVYRMIDAHGTVLYVGKAKSLKKRVASYTQVHRLPIRLQRMVSETSSMEFVTTNTETEALLLEANFIKKFSPRYNILLKDSKYFSFIALTKTSWPRLMKYRGVKNAQDQYFGPFASAEAIHNCLITLHKIFKLRSCSDAYFATRQRPCIQYHIKRCSAPCVGFITPENYADTVHQTAHVLRGKTHEVQQQLGDKMQQASLARDYEYAALYRDQIKALTQVQSQQTINTTLVENADIFGLYHQGDHACIQVFFFRSGSNYGSFSLFPQHLEGLSDAEILTSILPVFYEDKDPPSEILLSHSIQDQKILETALSQRSRYKVNFIIPKRGPKIRFIEHAIKNAKDALERRLSHAQSHRDALYELTKELGFSSPIQRIEVYDNSHIQGSDAIGAMIVADTTGLNKKFYRKFTIRQKEVAGDDYGMMREVLSRRFSGTLAQDDVRNPRPDLLLIDGGQGQVNVVVSVLESLNLKIPVLGIAKGPNRNAGRETFYQYQTSPFELDERSSVLYFLQRIRDEAHRFAIGTHRAKRMKHITENVMTDIPNIGAKRKKALLLHFGSTKSVQNARVEDLAKVDGISAMLAQSIYDFFHQH